MLYCTPGKFRVAGTGVDLSGVPDIELRSLLERAGDMVNEYCQAPTLPVMHDFRGGSVVGELGRWDMGGHLRPGHRRYYPLHKPLKAVEGFRIEVTNSQGITFDESELFVTPDYFEVVSMAVTTYGLFGAAIIPNIGLENPQVRTDYSYGRSITVINEELSLDAGKVFRARNQWWDPDVDPVVRKDGVEIDTPGDYTFDADEGTVTLVSANETTRVHLDYAHRLPPAIASATEVIAADLLGDRNLTRKGLHGLVELAVGPVRIRRDFPRAGVQASAGVNDKARSLLNPYRFISLRGS